MNAVYTDFKFVTYLSRISTDSVRFTPSIRVLRYIIIRIRIDGVNRTDSVDFLDKYVTNFKSAYTAITVDSMDQQILNKHVY